MKIFKSKHKLQKEILNIKNISFVPTMGGLHKGHISLIKYISPQPGWLIIKSGEKPLFFIQKEYFFESQIIAL